MTEQDLEESPNRIGTVFHLTPFPKGKLSECEETKQNKQTNKKKLNLTSLRLAFLYTFFTFTCTPKFYTTQDQISAATAYMKNMLQNLSFHYRSQEKAKTSSGFQKVPS